MPRQTVRKNDNYIELNQNTLKARIIRNLIDQRAAYLEGLFGEEQEAVPTELDEDSWLDAEHVDIAIQSLVAQRGYLNKVVGICPVFNAEAVQQAADNFAIDEMRELPKFEKLFGDRAPLPEVSSIQKNPRLTKKQKEEQIAERNKEERRRNRLDKIINGRAHDIVKQNNLDGSLFKLHLEAVTSNPRMLGNTAKQTIAFKDCRQLVIPIRHHGNHYTVAVVNLRSVNRKKIAEIKYYDSMGGDLDDDLQAQMLEFFTSKGFEPRYENHSNDDQREGYNCAIFASYGALDLLNLHAGKEERYLDDLEPLDDEEYQERLSGLRTMVVIKLMERANVTISDEYYRALKNTEKNVRAKSKDDLKREKLNRKINTLLEEIEDVLNRVKGKKAATRSVSKTAKRLAAIKPKELLGQMAKLVKELKEKQASLTKKRLKTPADKANLKAISNVLKKYHENYAQLQTRSRQTMDSTFSEFKDWISSLSIAKTLVYGALTSIAIFIAVPYVALFFATLGSTLPANPFVTIILGACAFTGSLYFAQRCFGAFATEQDEDEMPKNIKAKHQVTKDDIDEDLDEDKDEENDSENDEELDEENNLDSDQENEASLSNDQEQDEDDEDLESSVESDVEDVVLKKGRQFTPARNAHAQQKSKGKEKSVPQRKKKASKR